MASGVCVSVSAAQVGTYFLREYYHVLKQQPELCHQFYTDISTAMHIDGENSHPAAGMMEIHTLLTSLKFSGIEIKTANWLDSWNGGVLVMVSGLVRIEQSSRRRRFFQTFFLAPQEKGYFVLNDIFQFQEEEQAPQTSLADDNFETAVTSSAPVTEADASESLPEREVDESDLAAPVHSEESETVDKYALPEPQDALEGDDVGEEEIPVDEPVPQTSVTINVREQPRPPADEPVHEPPKHTYASILRVAKGFHGVPTVGQPAVSRRQPTQSDLLRAQEVTMQQPSSVLEKSSIAELEEAVVLDDEAEVKSVYVRNLPSSATASELEEEFKKFGRIKPEGVLIKSRKDADVYYAFVEFEDLTSVQNAVKASPIFYSGRQIYVEERKPGSLAARARRGKGGRGSGYLVEPPRGRSSGGRMRGIGHSSAQRPRPQDR
ncbi:nuclear transport factor 2-like isoform X2 [Wolffia australiana]